MGMLRDGSPPPSLPHAVSSGPSFERRSASAAGRRRPSTWKAKWCSFFVKVGLQTGQGSLRRTPCNSNRPVYVIGGSSRVRQTVFLRESCLLQIIQDRGRERPLCLHFRSDTSSHVEAPLCWIFRGQGTSYIQCSPVLLRPFCSHGRKKREYSYSLPLESCISLFWVTCEAAASPKCAGV